jgi:ABC-type nickel/cobalt efflux system permease component RcnA
MRSIYISVFIYCLTRVKGLAPHNISKTIVMVELTGYVPFVVITIRSFPHSWRVWRNQRANQNPKWYHKSKDMQHNKLEKFEAAINNGQFRDTGNIGQTRQRQTKHTAQHGKLKRWATFHGAKNKKDQMTNIGRQNNTQPITIFFQRGLNC